MTAVTFLTIISATLLIAKAETLATQTRVPPLENRAETSPSYFSNSYVHIPTNVRPTRVPHFSDSDQTASWYKSIAHDEQEKFESWWDGAPESIYYSVVSEVREFIQTATFTDLPTGPTSWSVEPTWWSAVPKDFLSFESSWDAVESGFWTDAVQAAESRAEATGWGDASKGTGSGMVTTTSAPSGTPSGATTASATAHQTGGAADLGVLGHDSRTSVLGAIVALGLAVVIGL